MAERPPTIPSAHAIPCRKRKIGIHAVPSNRNADERLWAVGHWASLINQLDAEVVFIGTLNDRPYYDRIWELLDKLNHKPTWAAVTAERSLFRALGGGCQVPIAAFGEVQGAALLLHGLVASSDYQQIVRGWEQGSPDDPEALGQALAAKLRAQGADRLLRSQ